MDTGTVYVLEEGGGGGGAAVAGSPARPGGEGRVTELLSGRELRWVWMWLKTVLLCTVLCTL